MKKINITKQELSKLVQAYYKKLENREVLVTIASKKECVGLYEDESCVTTISVKEKIKFLGLEKEIVEVISIKKVEEYLRALLAQEGMDLIGVTLNDGLSSHCEGYGLAEHDVYRPYCNGATLEFSSKNLLLERK